MKVLISAGNKTQTIVDGISSKFSSGGVDFLVVPFIEDIDDIYQRGEYFDKVILLDKSWTHDYADTSEANTRSVIGNFADQSVARGIDGISFIFLTQDRETASQIYEEILLLQLNSVILVKKPTYSVKFFVDLVRLEIDKFPEELVYKPILAEEIEIEHEEIQVEESKDEIEYTPDYGTQTLEDDPFGFGPEDASGLAIDTGEIEFPSEENDLANNEINDGTWIESPETEIQIQQEDLAQQGFDMPLSGDIVVPDESLENNGYENNPDIIGYEEEPTYTEKQEFVPQVGGWEDPSMQEEYYPQSGEIPNYSGGLAEDQMMQQPETGPNIFNNTDMYGPEQQPAQTDFEPMIEQGWVPDQDMYSEPIQQNTGYTGGIQDSDYQGEPEVVVPQRRGRMGRSTLNSSQIRATLDAFANRGNSIVVTGCGGCGTSTIALNLANIINRLGYTVLLVDLDTKNKAQSYISKSNYECLEPDSSGLLAAINSTSGINAHIAIVESGFHLLTMGMGSDAFEINKMIQKDRIGRFINLAKNSHNFVIYDIPFDTAVGFGKDFTFMADNVVITVDCSNWGVSKTLLNMCNIEDEDMYETLFNRGQILFNRYRVVNKIMERKVKTAADILKVMDYKTKELTGDDPGYYFQNMHICGLINDDPHFEDGWFGHTQYSDTQQGSKVFLETLKNIVLKS